MTAGQRNCYLAIEECLNRYGMDDVLVALAEHVPIVRAANSHAKLVEACRAMAEYDEDSQFALDDLERAVIAREALAAAADTVSRSS